MRRGLATFIESIRIAFWTLKSNKLRSLLTTLGIMIGVLTVIGVASIISGLNRAFQEQISFIGSNALYVQKYPWFVKGNWFEYRNRPNITWSDYEYLRKHLQLALFIAPDAHTTRDLRYRDLTLKGISVTGTTNEGIRIQNLVLASGRLFSHTEEANRRPVAILGSEIAEKLFGQKNPLRKRIKIEQATFEVIGVLEKRGSVFGESLDDGIYIPIGTLFKYFGSRRSISILVSTANPEDLDALEEEVRYNMRLAHRLRPLDKDDFSINKQDVLTSAYEQLTTGLYSAAIGIGLLSLIVGGIGIMNIMLVSVSERTREIGIRKAVGARRSAIVLQFLVEAVIICLLGGVIGILLGYALSFLVARLTPFPSSVPLIAIFIGLGFSSLVGIFFGIYPAGKAARLNPIDALRYE